MSQPTLIYSPELVASYWQPNAPDSEQSPSAKLSPIAAPSCASIGPTCQTSETSVQPTLPDLVESTYSQQEFPVSLRPAPGSAEGRQMTAGCGRRLCGLLVRLGQRSPCLRTLLESLLSTQEWCSSRCALKWRHSVTPCNRLLFRLAPSTPHTGGTAFGFLPTLRRMEEGTYQLDRGDKTKPRLTLAGLARLGLLPTLLRRDGGSLLHCRRGANSQGGEPLTVVVGQTLSPEFCEWFMGYPIDWTELEPSATPSSRRSRKSSSKRSGK